MVRYISGVFRGLKCKLGHGVAEHELKPKLLENFGQNVVDMDGMRYFGGILMDLGGYYHSVFLTREGQVWTTGFGGEGQVLI